MENNIIPFTIPFTQHEDPMIAAIEGAVAEDLGLKEFRRNKLDAFHGFAMCAAIIALKKEEKPVKEVVASELTTRDIEMRHRLLARATKYHAVGVVALKSV